MAGQLALLALLASFAVATPLSELVDRVAPPAGVSHRRLYALDLLPAVQQSLNGLTAAEPERLDATLPPVICNMPNLMKCFGAMYKAIGYKETQTSSAMDFVAQLRQFVGTDPKNVDKLCKITNTFTSCVGNKTEQAACFTIGALHHLKYQGDNSSAAQGNTTQMWALVHMLPAECSFNASAYLKTLEGHFKCVMGVSQSAVTHCQPTTTPAPDATACQALRLQAYRCVPALYEKCSMAAAKAVCNLMYVELSALPRPQGLPASQYFPDYKGCDPQCDFFNAAPRTTFTLISLLATVALTLQALL